HALVVVTPFLHRQMRLVFDLPYHETEYGIKPFTPLPKVRANPGAAATVMRFGSLGSMAAQKGWASLIEAFSRVKRKHPSSTLGLYGGDQAPATLPEGASFHGRYELSDVPRICSEFDVGVIPSLFPETYCMV